MYYRERDLKRVGRLSGSPKRNNTSRRPKTFQRGDPFEKIKVFVEPEFRSPPPKSPKMTVAQAFAFIKRVDPRVEETDYKDERGKWVLEDLREDLLIYKARAAKQARRRRSR